MPADIRRSSAHRAYSGIKESLSSSADAMDLKACRGAEIMCLGRWVFKLWLVLNVCCLGRWVVYVWSAMKCKVHALGGTACWLYARAVTINV